MTRHRSKHGVFYTCEIAGKGVNQILILRYRWFARQQKESTMQKKCIERDGNHGRFVLLSFLFSGRRRERARRTCVPMCEQTITQRRARAAREPRQRQKGRGIQRASMPRTEGPKRPREHKTIKRSATLACSFLSPYYHPILLAISMPSVIYPTYTITPNGPDSCPSSCTSLCIASHPHLLCFHPAVAPSPSQRCRCRLSSCLPHPLSSDQSDPAEGSGTLLCSSTEGQVGLISELTLNVLLSAFGSTLKRWRPLHTYLPDPTDLMQAVVGFNDDWYFANLRIARTT
jgi:hypothetical protein